MSWFRDLIGPDQGADTRQLCVRAVLLFVFGMLCIRIAGRRTFAQYSPLDIIVAIVVGSNISRIITGKAPFLSGIGATLLLVALYRAIAMLTLRWTALGRLIKGSPAPLILDGRIK